MYHFFRSKPNNYACVTMTSQQRWYWALDKINNKIQLFVQSVQLQNSFVKFLFPSIWRTSTKYSTKQQT